MKIYKKRLCSVPWLLGVRVIYGRIYPYLYPDEEEEVKRAYYEYEEIY